MPQVKIKNNTYRIADNWDQVDWGNYPKLMKKLEDVESIETKIVSHFKQMERYQKKYEEYLLQGKDSLKDKMTKAMLVQEGKIKILKDEIRPHEIECLELVSDIPRLVLASLDPTVKEANEILTENDVQYYVNYMYILGLSDLPNEKMSTLIWQSATDQEIEDQRKLISETPKYRIRARKKQKQVLDTMISSKFSIQDIWEQTTAINKHYQDVANRINQELKKNKHDEMEFLIGLLFVEDDSKNEILAGIKEDTAFKNYLEKYNQEMKVVIHRNVDLLFNQKKKLSVGDVIRIRNFFLLN